MIAQNRLLDALEAPAIPPGLLTPKRKRIVEGILFVLTISILCQLLYSPLGFNPTDEGYLLSASRRILDGEIPHRDYHSMRPAGTHYLHAHLLLWTGERLLWWGRFEAWLQLSVVAWLWVALARRAFTALDQSAVLRWTAGAIGVAASAHYFPIMPWNTIDGLFFMTVGIAVHRLAHPRWRPLALILLGLTPLFRQTFSFSLALLIIGLGEGLRWRSWLLAAIPGLAYIALMLVTGGFSNAVVQMTAHRFNLFPALTHFRNYPERIGQGAAVLGLALFLHARSQRLAQMLGSAFLFAGLGYAAYHCVSGNHGEIHGWLTFAATLALAAFLIIDRSRAQTRGAGAVATTQASWAIQLTFLALIVGWGCSLSEGWPSPAVGSAGLFVVLLGFAAERARQQFGTVWAPAVASLAILAPAAFHFHQMRTGRPYRDLPAALLKFNLGEVLPDGHGIRTNEHTYGFLKELRDLTDSIRAHGRKYIVLPDAPQFWVKSPQRNLLPSDWPCNPEIIGVEPWMFREIERAKQRGDTTFLVQRFSAAPLAFGPYPMSDDDCILCREVRRDRRLAASTLYFEVWE